jgi:Xaa-Pro aminopeptidase
MTTAMVREKLDQAVGILNELGLDAWLTLTRESSLTPDPCLDLVAGMGMTWQSAFLIGRGGERIAIVGRFDADNVRALGGYTEVTGYDLSLWPALREALARLAPMTIAVNYSESDPAADGLTHGMWRALSQNLADTPYVSRLVSAEALVAALRGRKSATEARLIRAAVRTTEQLFKDLAHWLKVGRTEQQIAARLTAAREALGLGTAWDEAYCPVVNAGPDSSPGHALPTKLQLARGQLLHIDFGVKQAGFCSDLQRCWYALDRGEKRPPADVAQAWAACWAALDAGAAALTPGARGWEVDAAARETLVAAGYPAYQHALGHQLGRVAHDGATLLGPRWERYGSAPEGVIEAGQIYTLELGTAVPDRGYIGLEEDVLVTDSGLAWLSKAQRRLGLV